MSHTLNNIQIAGKHKHFKIRELTDSGGYHRRVLTPDMTLADDEHQEVKDKAEELWTDEVKTAWTTFQAEQEAQRSNQS